MTTTSPATTQASTSRLNTALNTVFIELDLIIFFATGLATGFVSLILSTNQTIRPFFPQDATVWYTFTTDTIHTGVVFVIHYFVLAPLIFLIERAARSPSLVPARLALGMLSCTMVAILLVELGKGYVGRLRPSFAGLCLGESPSADWTSLPSILSDAACPTADKGALHDARRSFPSGHAALGVCGAAYFQMCVLRAAPRFSGKLRRLGLYILGWAAMAFGLWVAASRVFDNAHHVGDVAVGSVIGLWAAVIHFWFVTSEISRAKEEKNE